MRNGKNIRFYLRKFKNIPWIWAALGSLLLWFILSILTNKLNVESLIAASVNASLLAIISFGQMLVITTGGGAIDLSIPNVITLSAFLFVGLSSESNLKTLYTVPIVLLIGSFIGMLNAFAVLVLNIPPMVATLAIGYIVMTAILLYNPHFTTSYVPQIFIRIARGRLFGFVPIVLIIAVIFIILLTLMLLRTRYGKSLVAIGQNLEAAKLVGIPVNLVRGIAYIMSGLFAAVGGLLISSMINGAFLGLGDPYLLQTVGAVVVGGTLIFGGRAVPLGAFLGSLFFILLVTMIQVAGLKIGAQFIIEGLFIILIISMSTGVSKGG